MIIMTVIVKMMIFMIMIVVMIAMIGITWKKKMVPPSTPFKMVKIPNRAGFCNQKSEISPSPSSSL